MTRPHLWIMNWYLNLVRQDAASTTSTPISDRPQMLQASACIVALGGQVLNSNQCKTVVPTVQEPRKTFRVLQVNRWDNCSTRLCRTAGLGLHRYVVQAPLSDPGEKMIRVAFFVKRGLKQIGSLIVAELFGISSGCAIAGHFVMFDPLRRRN